MTITYQPKEEPERIISGSKPLASELWDILSAKEARRIAQMYINTLPYNDWLLLIKYADRVDELQGRAQ